MATPSAICSFTLVCPHHAGCRASDNAQASGNVAGLAGAAPGSCLLQVSNVTNIALAFGFSIFVLVYATAAYTGVSHLLPRSLHSHKKIAHLCRAKATRLR